MVTFNGRQYSSWQEARAEIATAQAAAEAAPAAAPAILRDYETQDIPKADRRANCPPESFTERYRPARLADVVGQPAAVAQLARFAAAPYSTAFLLEGPTGIGKTSAAVALAGDLGCDLGSGEVGGVFQIASGRQSAANVIDTIAALHHSCLWGSGWRVCIVNEADFMNPTVEALWLDILESLPARVVVIFTTNSTEKMSDRFLDRCERLKFSADAGDEARAGAAELVRRICLAETGSPDAVDPDAIADFAKCGKVSFRRVVQGVSRLLRASAAQSAVA